MIRLCTKQVNNTPDCLRGDFAAATDCSVPSAASVSIALVGVGSTGADPVTWTLRNVMLQLVNLVTRHALFGIEKRDVIGFEARHRPATCHPSHICVTSISTGCDEHQHGV